MSVYTPEETVTILSFLTTARKVIPQNFDCALLEIVIPAESGKRVGARRYAWELRP